MSENRDFEFYNTLFKDYHDVVKVDTLKLMLPKMGKNKIYNLLQSNQIYSKKIGRDYYIPKVSVIDFFTKK